MRKTILITGATDGIGQLTANKLAAQGHHLIIHGRSPDKLNHCAHQLTSAGAATVDTFCADFSDLAQVAGMSTALKKHRAKIDVLINNAGVYKMTSPQTDSGFDARFVVNTIAPYQLTTALTGAMPATGRVINLSSAAQAEVNLKAVSGGQILADEFEIYAQSKLALTMWSLYLGQHRAHGEPAIIAVNPGSLLASKMVREGFGVPGKDIGIGADILTLAALGESFANASGLYFDNDRGEFADPHPDALNETKCRALIQVMDSLIQP